MKKVESRVGGALIILLGVGVVAFSGYQLLQQQWLWLASLFAGMYLVLVGVRVYKGDRMREVFDDLLSFITWSR